MDLSPIDRVGVVGSGTMGAGIAELCAVRGLDVTLAVSRESSLASAPRRIEASLERAVSRGRIPEQTRDAALDRITVTTDLADLGDRHLVVEAVPEDESLKLGLFAALDKVVADDAILASTTSAITISRLAGVTSRPHQVLGIHFFNPVGVMSLVEVVPTLLTDAGLLDRAEEFVAGALGKEPIRVSDRSGFVVNALLIPYLLAAIRMADTAHASSESIDRAMELGCAHPMGPLRLADFIGLDVVAAIAGALYEEFKEPLYAPPPLLSRMVTSGLLGHKSGRGFYAY
ncbi:3-hydroxybutyryl-CoA dehydrogenase [Streptomyces venetus]|uniref:3-hydroxybutyryl-CoA dehydrogenase n=1 Tax=Streptomyces venetus TaxID=1701086 RepID=UPI0031EF457D